ncbi:hypothetical protein GDO81_007319 [Engystomops pustulosus]|uniref:Uncharacterized protein n=1 Tax=Engystomops pustulosus TaxID=76066 RepID=A0AAV7C694_ENGPU|nr:hypothetical protein GDO81_007319 [Engystomops pustulosus]
MCELHHILHTTSSSSDSRTRASQTYICDYTSPEAIRLSVTWIFLACFSDSAYSLWQSAADLGSLVFYD